MTNPSSNILNTGKDMESGYEVTGAETHTEKGSEPVGSVAAGPAPDGGFRAWLVAAGASTILFCSLGFANSFGTFEQYYVLHQLRGESPSKISWIGSLAAFLQFFAGLISGPLFDRYGAKVIRPAAATYIFAMMMLSLCKTYWQVMLVQGVLMGVVMGMMQIPAFAAVSQYFDKNRAAALGVSISGSSIGGIVIPIALSKMLNGTSLGFGWSIRITGFMMTPLLAFACFAVKERLPRRNSQFFIVSAFSDPRFAVLVVAMFFQFMGMMTPLFYLPIYATTQGMGATLAGYLLAMLNAASTFGRIIPGILADRYGRINVFAFGGVATGVTAFCMSSVKTNTSLTVFAIFFGFTSGTIISGVAAAFTVCLESQRDVGTYMGMGLAVAGVGSLIGPPVNGAFVNAYHSYFEVSMFSGAMCILGGIIATAAKFWMPGGYLGRA